MKKKQDVKRYKIGYTDIFIDIQGKTQGKITISDTMQGSFSYYWGAMGGGMIEFLKCIDNDYFAKNLCNTRYVFDAKQSVKEVRRFIKSELSYELPFYKFMVEQKEMRKELKRLESCETDRDFVYGMQNLPDSLMCLDSTYDNEKEFKDIIKSMFTCEPWHFIANTDSEEYKFICGIHKKLIKII